MKVNLLSVAQKLNDQVQMGEGEFRSLMKALFPDVPSYHINTVVRLTKSEGKKGRFSTITDRLGGKCERPHILLNSN